MAKIEVSGFSYVSGVAQGSLPGGWAVGFGFSSITPINENINFKATFNNGTVLTGKYGSDFLYSEEDGLYTFLVGMTQGDNLPLPQTFQLYFYDSTGVNEDSDIMTFQVSTEDNQTIQMEQVVPIQPSSDYLEFKSPYQASLIGTTIAGRLQNGVLMSVVVGEVNFTPDSNIDFHVSALGKETVYTYLPNEIPALQYQFLNGTEESGFVCGPPYIGGLYQINSNTEAHPADYVPTAPAGDYDVEIRMWFEDRLNRYKGSSTEVLKLHVTSGATSEDTGTVSFISSTVEPPDSREPLTAPEISIQGMNVSISQAEGGSIWYTTDGTNPVPGPNPEAEFAEYSEGIITQSNGTYYESPFAIEETSIIKARATDYTGEYRDSDIAVYEAVPTPSEVTGPFSVKKISQLPFGEITEDTKFLVENNKSFYQGSLKDLREYLTLINVDPYKKIIYPSGIYSDSVTTDDIKIIGDEESERFLILYSKNRGSSKEYVFGYYNDLSKAPVTVDYPSQADKTSKPNAIKYFEGRFYARFYISSFSTYKWYVLSGTSWVETTDPEDAYEGTLLAITSDYVYTNVGRNSCPGQETPGEVYRYTKATGQYEVVTSSIPQTSDFIFYPVNMAYGSTTYLVSDSFYSLAVSESEQSIKVYYTQNQGLSWIECESSTEGWMLYPMMGVGKYQGKYCISAIFNLTGELNNDSPLALALSEDGIHFQIKEDEIISMNSLGGYPPLYIQGDRFSYDCMSVVLGQEIKINLGFNVEQFLLMKGTYLYTGRNKIITVLNGFLYYLPV